MGVKIGIKSEDRYEDRMKIMMSGVAEGWDALVPEICHVLVTS